MLPPDKAYGAVRACVWFLFARFWVIKFSVPDHLLEAISLVKSVKHLWRPAFIRKLVLRQNNQ